MGALKAEGTGCASEFKQTPGERRHYSPTARRAPRVPAQSQQDAGSMEEVPSLTGPPRVAQEQHSDLGISKESVEEARRGAAAEGTFGQECACTAPALRRRQDSEHLKDPAQAEATGPRGASPTPGLGNSVGGKGLH